MFKELKKFNAQQENLLKWHQLFYGNQYEEAASKKRQKKTTCTNLEFCHKKLKMSKTTWTFCQFATTHTCVWVCVCVCVLPACS